MARALTEIEFFKLLEKIKKEHNIMECKRKGKLGKLFICGSESKKNMAEESRPTALVYPTRHVGENIKRIREQKNMTTTGLAAMCDLSNSTISKIENGYLTGSLTTWIKIATALKVDLFKDLINSPLDDDEMIVSKEEFFTTRGEYIRLKEFEAFVLDLCNNSTLKAKRVRKMILKRIKQEALAQTIRYE